MSENSNYVPRVVKITPTDWEKLGAIANFQRRPRPEIIRSLIRSYIKKAFSEKIEIMYQDLKKEMNYERN